MTMTGNEQNTMSDSIWLFSWAEIMKVPSVI